MKAQHTPGPWEVSCGSVNSASQRNICQWHVPLKDQPEESRANARLIAAAPDLLVALIDLCNELHNGRKYNVKKDFSLLLADSMARGAIAKATGNNTTP